MGNLRKTTQALSPYAYEHMMHLKQWQPETYKRLEAEGTLNQHCQELADQLVNEASDLTSRLPHNQAFEMIRDRLLPPPTTR